MVLRLFLPLTVLLGAAVAAPADESRGGPRGPRGGVLGSHW